MYGRYDRLNIGIATFYQYRDVSHRLRYLKTRFKSLIHQYVRGISRNGWQKIKVVVPRSYTS